MSDQRLQPGSSGFVTYPDSTAYKRSPVFSGDGCSLSITYWLHAAEMNPPSLDFDHVSYCVEWVSTGAPATLLQQTLVIGVPHQRPTKASSRLRIARLVPPSFASLLPFLPILIQPRPTKNLPPRVKPHIFISSLPRDQTRTKDLSLIPLLFFFFILHAVITPLL